MKKHNGPDVCGRVGIIKRIIHRYSWAMFVWKNDDRDFRRLLRNLFPIVAPKYEFPLSNCERACNRACARFKRKQKTPRSERWLHGVCDMYHSLWCDELMNVPSYKIAHKSNV